MIYVLTEWDGKGSGEKTLITEDKSKAMRNRECTLTAESQQLCVRAGIIPQMII